MAKNDKELVRQTSGAGPVDNHRVDFIGAMSLRIDQVKTFNFSVAEKTIYQTLTQATYYIDYVHKSLRSRLFHQAQQKKYRNDDVAHR